ncbi:hypothetical protein PspLS_10018 [Pyricularia sp. CBS 133598]|nr:hypothetical protein PspLS_10018 [Pyricularia sp. CBS 133598]
MQFKSILLALAAASSAVNALTIPEGTGLETRGLLSTRSPAPQPQNKKGGGGGGKGKGKGKDCAAAKKLKDGIDKNIKDQEGELKSANDVREIVGRNTVDEKEFKQAKDKLLGFVNAGIRQREENQKIAPKGNAAIAGLAKVAEAQKTELEQATGLKGNSQDLATLVKMKKEFDDGIKLNQQNAKDAIKGCE